MLSDGAPPTDEQRIRGCLLGGAVGDALGAPVEFLHRAEILRRFGPEGLTNYAPAYGGLGRITDETQMTLFTAEGIIRGCLRFRHERRAQYFDWARRVVDEGRGTHAALEQRFDSLYRQRSKR